MNKAIICPTCAASGTKNVLGSVNEKGYLIVKRNAYGTTIIYAQVYQVVCQCGYGTVVVPASSGKAYISTQATS